jgi:hypothetical protein
MYGKRVNQEFGLTMIVSSSRLEYFFGDEALVASVAVKTVDKLLQWRFAKILGSNVVRTKVGNVGPP